MEPAEVGAVVAEFQEVKKKGGGVALKNSCDFRVILALRAVLRTVVCHCEGFLDIRQLTAA
jgi:hypothetical protein